MFIPKHEIEIRTSRSSGPGGQHVNKTETKVELRFHLENATWLTENIKIRFKFLYPNRINKEGEVIVTCDSHRSQLRNQDEAFKTLEKLLIQASIIPKKRIKTKATRSSQKKRVDQKKRHSETKKTRNKISYND
jgi:ribosome-associated protein